MELTTILLLIVSGWTICLALPVQVDLELHREPINDNLLPEIKTVFELIEEANKGISKPLVHGDIAINTGRSVKNCYDCFWPASQNGVVPVPYVISSAYSNIQIWLINEAMRQIELMTCINFVQRTLEWDYLSIESGNGCWSNVARQGGKQIISLDKSGCLGSGVIQHELMHSLGFYHEHSRNDRDNYIVIRWQYIDEADKYNFKTEDTNNLGLPYDYNSVMHYQNTAFTNTTGQTTIVAKGQCSGSYIKVYNGNSKKDNVLLDKTCGNGIIPPLVSSGNSMLIEFVSNQAPHLSTFRGVYKTVSYGGTLTSPFGIIFSPSYGKAYPNDIDAEWSIIAPPKSKVVLNFIDFDLQDCSDCSCDSLTIIDGTGPTSPVLGKYCSTTAPDSLKSSGNVMILKFHSDSKTSSYGFYLSYSLGKDQQ
ncbi:astacin-like metalloendopeptidase [Pelobates cultripes]|uniref:Metalloendopeptidase n=1 Tax=Pelobates cultripes TaxID=61616 RepID=A0AAD1R9N2_PELCU|nr:astacin-like metalloendopeptidase [Pelobates cultripes]